MKAALLALMIVVLALGMGAHTLGALTPALHLLTTGQVPS